MARRNKEVEGQLSFFDAIEELNAEFEGQMMENHDFDETTERHYSPRIGMWMHEWDNDPTVWQIPSMETPYGESLSAEYDRLYRQTKTLVDVVMEQPAFQQASSQFRRYLEALVVARQAQMAPDRLMVVEDEQFRQLPMSHQYAVAQQLQRNVETVFSWMKEQGMDPIPQRRQCPVLCTQDQARRVLDEF